MCRNTCTEKTSKRHVCEKKCKSGDRQLVRKASPNHRSHHTKTSVQKEKQIWWSPTCAESLPKPPHPPCKQACTYKKCTSKKVHNTLAQKHHTKTCVQKQLQIWWSPTGYGKPPLTTTPARSKISANKNYKFSGRQRVLLSLKT